VEIASPRGPREETPTEPQRTWTLKGRKWTGASSSSAPARAQGDEEFTNIRVDDIDYSKDSRSREEVDQSTAKVERAGAELPIKDGLDQDVREWLSEDELNDDTTKPRVPADDVTTDEERELPGVKRPKRGAGWWGRGRALRTTRKGIGREFVDGAGLPSPGRWKIKDRILPDHEVAQEIRQIVWNALRNMEELLPGGSLRDALYSIMAGGNKSSPFPQEKVDELKEELRRGLDRNGFGRGEPRPGDAKQCTDVRLLQA